MMEHKMYENNYHNAFNWFVMLFLMFVGWKCFSNRSYRSTIEFKFKIYFLLSKHILQLNHFSVERFELIVSAIAQAVSCTTLSILN